MSDERSLNFIEQEIEADLASGRFEKRVHTRFPPEPNGYLHIGHAKSICLNFGLAKKYGGKCNLRFDDTNPSKEEQEYVDSIQRDVEWLGFQWDALYYASQYFEELYGYAETLIRAGKAYVCELTADQIRETRGSLTQGAQPSPWRDRPAAESLELFRKMRAGAFPDGSRTLRAKIDLNSGNINLRDPVLYRILRAHHHRTGDTWCIYPMYDFAHGQCDSLERITHSICTLEFEDHRPLYDWFIQNIGLYAPRQIEFARLNLTWTMMSKRKLLELVKEGNVRGWDDPRMPTLSGLRRRGYTPEALRAFCERIGVAKMNSTIEMGVLENALRDDLNRRAPRAMAVLRPLRVVVENLPENHLEEFELAVNPEDPAAGVRKVPFTRELFIEREDFLEDPPKKYFRLAPGREVRLRGGYFLKCERAVKDPSGAVTELRCTVDPATRGGQAPDGRKVKGTIHWVSATKSISAEVRLYEALFTKADPDEGGDYRKNLNPKSLGVLNGCRLEPGLAEATSGRSWQFERHGYFCADLDSKPGALVFNRSVPLRDTWAKEQAKE